MEGAREVLELLGQAGPAEESNLDWPSARREGLLGLIVSSRLRRKLQVPEYARETYFGSVGFEMKCIQLLKEVSEEAFAKGIPVLAFKGSALALGLYPHPGQRAFGDIDLAVPERDHPGFLQVLEKLGFVGRKPIFIRNGFCLDLHTHPLHQLVGLVGHSAADWWKNVVPLGSRAGAALRLTHEHEFVLSLFHGAKHSFSRAGWVVDIALLARMIESAQLTELVNRYRIRSQLSYAMECLESWFNYRINTCFAAGYRRSIWEKRFMRLILERKAPDFLGMLTPVRSAHSPPAALKYLRSALYPEAIPWWTRTKQLLDMARVALTR